MITALKHLIQNIKNFRKNIVRIKWQNILFVFHDIPKKTKNNCLQDLFFQIFLPVFLMFL